MTRAYAHVSIHLQRRFPMTNNHHKFRTRILVSVLPIAVVALMTLSHYNYNNTKQNLLHHYEESKLMTESHIVDAISLIDASYRMLEVRLEAEMKDPGASFLKEYERANGNIDAMDTSGLKKQFGNSFDFLIISPDTTVIKSTEPAALNFNFKAFSPDLGNKINRIRLGKDVWFEQLRTNVVTGRLSKFSYIPTADNAYLLEVAYSVDGFNKLLDELKPQSITDALVAISPLVQSVRIFDTYGYQIVDSGENYKPTPESLKIAERAVREKNFEVRDDDSVTRKYLLIDLTSKRERTLANADRIVEITYDRTIIDQQLSRLTWASILVSTLILLGLCFGVIYFSRKLTRPIEALTASSREITQGNFSTRVDVDSKGEVGELAHTFNTMMDEINRSFHEIEAQKSILEEYSRTLEEKVDIRTQEIAQQKEALVEKNRELELAWIQANEAAESKSSFLAMMSHEIRTPINGVIGMAYLILRTSLTPRQRDYVHKIMSSGENLLEIINDVLEISKLEAGKTHLETIPFSLDEVIELTSNQVGFKSAEKGLELVFSSDSSIPHTLSGDPLRLRQVLLNLLNNAIKFTEAGEILVSAKLSEETDEAVCLQFEVKDTGIGIDAEILDHLFQPFQQADNSISRRYGGTGLGLSICRHFIELMHGSIQVESSPGKGSRFLFTAWFSRCAVPPEVQSRLPEELRNLNILVVDDSETTRDVLADMLTPSFSRIRMADSGNAALEIIEEAEKQGTYFDIVLMDWKMPGLDGIETAYEIKKRSLLRHVPAVLMLTGYDLDEAKKNSKSRNIDAFLSKPVLRSSLVRTITQAIAPASAEQHALTPALVNHLVLSDPEDQVSILLAEDSPINQQIVLELLEQPRITVDVVNTGILAIAALAEKDYDLVLMDIQMPELDGLEATRRIRSMEKHKDLPIIALTAHALDEDRIKFLDAGMSDYMSKPLNEQKLYQLLIKWIAKGMEVVTAEMPPIEGTEGQTSNLRSFQTKTPMANLKGNWQQYVKLLTDFHSAYKDSGMTLDDLLEAGDYEKARSIVHSIRGIAGNLGAVNLFIVAQTLEADMAKCTVGLSDDGYVAFKTELASAMEEIKSIQKGHGIAAEDDRTDPARMGMGELFTELKQLLKAGDPEAMLLIQPLNRILENTEHRFLGNELIRQIGNYDFDEALSTVERLETEIAG